MYNLTFLVTFPIFLISAIIVVYSMVKMTHWASSSSEAYLPIPALTILSTDKPGLVLRLYTTPIRPAVLTAGICQ